MAWAKAAGTLTVVNVLAMLIMLYAVASNFQSPWSEDRNVVGYVLGGLAAMFAANAVCLFRFAIARR